VPSQFSQLLTRALSADVDERFPSVREMAQQMSNALKKVSLRKDLHSVLAKSVVEARATIGLGTRTGDPSTSTPIADFIPDALTPPPGIAFPPKPPAPGEPKRGLRHRLETLFRRRG